MKNARLWIAIYTELAAWRFSKLSRDDVDALKSLSELLSRRERIEIDTWLQSRPTTSLSLSVNGLILHRSVTH